MRTILIAGDVTIDWNLAHERGERLPPARWTGDDACRIRRQRGGAALLADLAAAVVARAGTGGDVQVRGIETPTAHLEPQDPRFHHSYALWTRFEESNSKGDVVGRWRVARFLGLDRRAGGRETASGPASGEDESAADLVVLDDAGLGFREDPGAWPRAITEPGARPWVVLKMARPVADGSLWRLLIDRHAERLIVVLTIGDLRRTDVRISRGLSWERTAEELLWALRHNPRVNGLARAAAAIVSFDAAGAFVLPDPSRGRPTLLYDPLHLEGERAPAGAGAMMGYTTTLAGGVVREWLRAPERPDFVRGVRSGIHGMRRLWRIGYEVDEKTGDGPRFPLEAVAEALDGEGDGLAAAPVPVGRVRSESGDAGAAARPLWSILEERHAGDLDALARAIVRDGWRKALADAPIGVFGQFVTADRAEIEALRVVRGLIDEYCGRDGDQPLSIAVFGPPGAGKSFAVKEIAKVAGCGRTEPKTFNLSQFDDPAELLGAFHQVRDIALRGKLPLVFWDEFDTALGGERLGWLRYFLAPMQDGEFQEGPITHPIGRAIFVFAGGTSDRMENFAAGLGEGDAKARKVPDFRSRLRGFLDVLGPNPRGGDADADPYYVLRRALLLRSMIERFMPQLIRGGEARLDTGVLRAFLRVPAYRHGARSMEALLAMSRHGEVAFSPSSLPPEDQLALHVDAKGFMALVEKLELEGDLLERLAAAQHALFCERLRAKGYQYGPVTNDGTREHSSLVPFEDLPEDEKEQNRGAVRDIPAKLARFGYVMVPARRGEAPFRFPPEEVETLAETEHARWMDAKLRAGWRYDRSTRKDKKLHALLVPWAELPEGEKDKDRGIVRDIPELLARVGYTVAGAGE